MELSLVVVLVVTIEMLQRRDVEVFEKLLAALGAVSTSSVGVGHRNSPPTHTPAAHSWHQHL